MARAQRRERTFMDSSVEEAICRTSALCGEFYAGHSKGNNGLPANGWLRRYQEGRAPNCSKWDQLSRQSPLSRSTIELRARTASFKWQVSPLLLDSLPWHRARTEPSRKVSCQSASCRATLFGGSREKCFALEAVPLTERSTSLNPETDARR